MTSPRRYPAQLLLILLACPAMVACGGGGGGTAPPPLVTAAQLELQDLTIAQNQDRSLLRIDLVGTAQLPALLRFDLRVDPSLLAWIPADVRAVNALPNLQAHIVRPGELRVVIGDATNRDATAMIAGGLVDLPVAVLSPRVAGDVSVSLLSVIASDSKGEAIALATGRPAAVITVE